MERIDFSRSNIYWDGSSKGIFKLVSVLKVKKTKSLKVKKTKSLKGEKTYGLGESVLAGNMFVSDGLLKQPSYLFQVAGSTEEQYIFRTLLPNQKRIKFPWRVNKNSSIGDSYRKPHTEFHLDIKYIPTKEVNDYNEIEEAFYDNNFTARVQIEGYGSSCTIEFPINHINVKPEIKMWQAETGPILFPILEDSAQNDFEYLPSFTHFNSLNRIDIFYDYPFGYRSKKLIDKGIYKNMMCEIELLTNLN